MIYNWLIKHKKSAYGIAIGFLIFTILVYAFRSCWFFRPLYEYINYWALPLSAAFMLVLAYMAYISITESRRIRETEKRERLLNDIIDWAEAITTFLSAQIVTDMTDESRILTGAANRLKELNGLAAKGIRIELLASLLFLNNDDLLRDIPNFRLRISKHTNFLILVVKRKVKYVEKGAKAEGIHGGRLLNDALNLIRLATRIYTEIK